MSDAPTDPAPSPGRRSDLIVAALIVGFIGVIGLLALWGVFFGSEAPAAPTLEDALQVLVPTASPGP